MTTQRTLRRKLQKKNKRIGDAGDFLKVSEEGDLVTLVCCDSRRERRRRYWQAVSDCSTCNGRTLTERVV